MKAKRQIVSRAVRIAAQASEVTRHDETWDVIRRRQLAQFEKEQLEQQVSELTVKLNVARRRIADLQATIDGYSATITSR